MIGPNGCQRGYVQIRESAQQPEDGGEGDVNSASIGLLEPEVVPRVTLDDADLPEVLHRDVA